ncbi:MAG: efflux RND transporter periplasmic adaptor subunit [Synechococcales cyanobacterium M58_A2018_015]|nr:efflux RND transporter periplasmic adaptor subunit [Synechococcales cyanobacterium M58_A2018_015]
MDDLHLPEPQPKQPESSGWSKLFLGTGLGVLLTLVALASWRQFQPAPSSPLAASDSPIAHTAVTVTTVTETRIQQTLEATGTVTAAELLPVLTPTSGLVIQRVLVEEGDLVQQGQVLAILDTSVLQSQLREAEAEVRAATAKLAELQAGNRIETIEQARAEVQSAIAEVARAESDVQLAEQRLQRNQRLAAEGAIATDRLDEVLNQARSSRSDLVQAQATLQQSRQRLVELEAGARPEAIAQAEAELDASNQRVQTLTAQLENTQVLAPRSGKIVERQARVGDVTSPSSQLFSLIDQQQLELWLEVPETQLSQVRRQQDVWISSDAQPQLRLSGRVTDIDPLVDPESRLATVKVSLPEGDLASELHPGMFLRGSIVTASRPGLSLPAEAILPQPDGRIIVYRVSQNNEQNSEQLETRSNSTAPSTVTTTATVSAQPIEIGELLPNGRVEVKQGLQVGDRVVVKGAAYLADGDRVNVVPELPVPE